MKKKCSLLMTAAVLICAAMTFTGCGRLGLQSGQVYEKISNETNISKYYCFHSDGNLYMGYLKPDGKLYTSSLTLPYSIDIRTERMTVGSIQYSFKLEKSCLQITNIAGGPPLPKELVLTAWPTEDEMKKALLPE